MGENNEDLEEVGKNVPFHTTRRVRYMGKLPSPYLIRIGHVVLEQWRKKGVQRKGTVRPVTRFFLGLGRGTFFVFSSLGVGNILVVGKERSNKLLVRPG